MKNIYIDSTTNDLELTKNNFRFTENDSEYVSQKLEEYFNTFKGEYWLNVDLGIPYFDKTDRRSPLKNILGVFPDMNFIRAIFLKEINKIAEIKQVLKLNIEVDDSLNTLYIDMILSLSSGSLELSFVL